MTQKSMIAEINTKGTKYYCAKTGSDHSKPTEAPGQNSKTCKEMNRRDRYSVLPVHNVLGSLSRLGGNWHVTASVRGAFAQMYDFDLFSITQFTKNYKKANVLMARKSNETYRTVNHKCFSDYTCLPEELYYALTQTVISYLIPTALPSSCHAESIGTPRCVSAVIGTSTM